MWRLGKYLSSLTKPELEALKEQLNLTDDECLVFESLSKGYTLSKASFECCLSESTIQRRVEDICKKIEKTRTGVDEMKKEVPISEKYNLTLEEASAYFNIGIDRLREITNENREELVLMIGTKRLIKKARMEKWIDRTFVL